MKINNISVLLLTVFGCCMVSNNAFPVRDMSPYCEDVAKMTNLCNEIFTNLACPKTCTSLKVQKECGRRKVAEERRFINRTRFRRIVGGGESDHGSWPWHVSLQFQGVMRCAGSILSENWILTAANCFDEDITSNNPSDWKVSAGDFRILRTESTEQIRNVEKIIKHENNIKFWKMGYKNIPDDFDIALLKLDVPLNLNDYISPICLPETDQPVERFQADDQCYIVGWGDKKPSKFHDKLHEVPVKLVPRDVCNLPIRYNGTIHHRAICAGYDSEDVDACDYDSGGALTCRKKEEWVVVGLISWGYKCGKPMDYGVYTNVPELRSWVVETLLSYTDTAEDSVGIHQKVKQEAANQAKVPATERKTYLERFR